MQFVPLQAGVLLVGAELPQLVHPAPHALTSLATQLPLHRCVPTVHWHALFMQCAPPVHASPQPLQLLSSFVVLRQAPLHGL
jgi:hypothetical protein